MIPVSTYEGRDVAVFGLGRSGLAVADALRQSGARPVLSDDSDARLAAARDVGFEVMAPDAIDWPNMAALVLSPGVPLTHPEPHPVVKAARGAGVPIVGDMELFAGARADLPAHKVVAVTGTNGKSTTTALIGHVLKSAGRDVAIGGNIGEPVLALDPLPESGSGGGIYVLELSSYQIDLCPGLVPDVGVFLNLSPDHLDRHGDMAGYAAAKERLFDGQKEGHTAVIGVDDAHGLRFADMLAGRNVPRVVPISGERMISGGVSAVCATLYDQSGDHMQAVGSFGQALGLRGAHNGQNAAAAYAACRALGLEPGTILDGLLTFPGLAHRMESVARANGVEFVNDSKATNVDAAARALASFENIYWIAGGRPKSVDLSALRAWFPRIRRAYLIGEAADGFAASLDGDVDHVIAGDLGTALTEAWGDARGRGSAVILLSPACASFDQFPNFEARGDAFKAAVRALLGRDAPAAAGGGA